MSGPRDTRESAEEAGASAVPADSVPPSFGGAVPPADQPPADAEATADAADSTAAAPLRLPAFGLQAPWWAAESSETAPPEDGPPAKEPVSEDPRAGDEEPEAEDQAGPETTEDPPGTLVAGVGVPSFDSRGAVPVDPIVKRPVTSGDTDPDGFPAVRPEDDPQEDAATEAAKAPAPETAEDDDAAEGGAADDTVIDNIVVEDAAEDRPAEIVPAAPGADARAAETAQDSAFEKARQAEDAASAGPASTGPASTGPASAGPVLEPDAILPVGFTPPTGSGPFPNTEQAGDAAPTVEQPAVIAPVYHAEGGVPIDTPPPPGQPAQDAQGAPKGRYNKRRPLLIGGGAAVVLAAAVALFAIGGTGSDGDQSEDANAAESPAAAQSSPAATPSPTASPTPSGKPASIDDERTDPKPLAFRDVFPTGVVKLGGRTYTRDRWSLNREASYAARGSMLRVLEQEKCRKIIRATFIDRSSSLAVTSGIAVMPTKEAALAVSRAGDPAAYEWFRGMGGKRAPNLDRAGGYAAATVRGRYVAYAYVQWANGKPAQPGDPVIKQAAKRFLDYDLRPIMARARN